MYALRERRVHVTQEDFEMAVTKVTPAGTLTSSIQDIPPKDHEGCANILKLRIKFFCRNQNCAKSLYSRPNFISTFTKLHSHGDNHWPMETLLLIAMVSQKSCFFVDVQFLFISSIGHAERFREKYVNQEALEVVGNSGHTCMQRLEVLHLMKTNCQQKLAVVYIRKLMTFLSSDQVL